VTCAAVFTVWALTAPAYSSGETILEVNGGTAVRLALVAPLVVSSGFSLLLHLACRHNLAWPRIAASAVAWVLVAFAVAAVFSIGVFVMPVAILLVAAAHLTPVAVD